MLQDELRKNLRFNFTVNLLDAAFYGVGSLGLASFVTVIPLFLNSLHASTLLIGLITSFQAIGWQLPQLFTANRVAKLRRYKPFVVFMTVHERWPFVGLVAVILLMPTIGEQWTLALSVILVMIYAFGGGLAATAWQSMIAKVMPKNRIGTFYGAQSGVANLTGAIGAVAAGIILNNLGFPNGYFICFLITAVTTFLSMGFLASTREPHHEHEEVVTSTSEQPAPVEIGWRKMLVIIREDVNFRWFLTARVLAQFANMALAFYTLYAVRHFGMNEQTAGILTGVLLLSKTVAGPLLGWLGDRWGHRTVLFIGTTVMSIAAGLALTAPNIGWFYAIYALAGLADASMWGVAMAFIQEFGAGQEKPLYIGLGNTLIAPFALLAPFVGGALAEGFGFGATFMVSVISGLLAALVFRFMVRSPQASRPLVVFSQQAVAGD